MPRATAIAQVVGVMSTALLTAGCGREPLDAATRARIYGCLDRAAPNLRALPARGYALDGLGCEDLKPDDVRDVLPAWRAERAAHRLVARTRD